MGNLLHRVACRLQLHEPTKVKLRSGWKLWCHHCDTFITKVRRIDRQGWFNLALATWTMGLSVFIGFQYAILVALLMIFGWTLGRFAR